MKSELTLAFNEITERFGLSGDIVMEALEAAMISAYRRAVNASSAQEVAAKVHLESGDVTIFAEKEVVEGVENPQTEVELDIARQYDSAAEPGDMVLVESTPEDFGRVAAQTAKQVILQRLREAERDAQYDEFAEREGDMVHGTVHSITPQAVTIGLGRAEAILPRNQQIPGEHFRVRDRVRTYVLEVRKSSRGPVIVLSRSHPNMLRRLLEMEVPEINQGLVEVKAIAREAGKRAKVAVAATREGVDPVGACVGLRGVRIQSIVRDLNDEKIDVIEWNPDPGTFIAKALSPARVSGVYLDEDPGRGKTAMVIVPEDQLSLAIGRAGVNARLGARLTGWRIDIKSLPEAAADSVHLLQTDGSYAEMAEEEADAVAQLEMILAKKAENRPITPEEYQVMTQFVDRVQTEVHRRLAIERARAAELRAQVPEQAYTLPLEETEISTRVSNLLSDAEVTNIGEVMERLLLDEEQLLEIPGIGPKSVEELRDVIETIEFVEPEPEPAEVLEGEAELAEEAEAAAVEQAEEPVDQELVVEAAAEVDEAAAAEAAPAEEAEPVLEAPLTEAEEGEPESVDAIFAAVAEQLGIAAEDEEELDEEALEDEDGEEDEERAERTRQRQKRRVVEFDPESGETIVRRRRKKGRDGEDWEGYY